MLCFAVFGCWVGCMFALLVGYLVLGSCCVCLFAVFVVCFVLGYCAFDFVRLGVWAWLLFFCLACGFHFNGVVVLRYGTACVGVGLLMDICILVLGAVGLFASFCCLLVCGGGFVLVVWVGFCLFI